MTKPITVWMTRTSLLCTLPTHPPTEANIQSQLPVLTPGRSATTNTNSKHHQALTSSSIYQVVLILEELQVPYEIQSFKFDDVKNPPFININPNGRAPGKPTHPRLGSYLITRQTSSTTSPKPPLTTKTAIVDPNTNLTLWESGAIIQYLIDVYDTDHKLSFPNLPERHLCNQYLHFQMSGQGPYFGQAAWFAVLHPEKLPSVIDRYVTEVRRVLGVLDTVLADKTWLVGDKLTFADLAFVPWNGRLNYLLPEAEQDLAAWPNVQAWQRRMEARPAWRTCIERRDRLMDEQGLQPNGMPKGVSNIREYEELIARNAEGRKE
ncbi:hypothetical protein ASPACDRAFT_120172 [Aspergillus aculeatus ATCC 16872]|uniref:glutathione transferase n=1 Tax=Aspergillus aculeatus (strain ATCC 16872 / CBS 172.66 / WB 5094) TaxID=690307 RepID=A0A1L9WSB2_ASPA1|nr:uncharacterized protein ASPACDRAFT_120172 [Aspergillus aculeatus ATCC 16872]OJJ99076.1 hypothetical protein ASPACDRAFT_120172 [Aspergillus aculeatus ATCC 16872]